MQRIALIRGPLACLVPLLAWPVSAMAQSEFINFLPSGGYLEDGKLVLYGENSITWSGGSAFRSGSVVVGEGWDTYPGGRAVLVSQLVIQERSSRTCEPWPAPQPQPWRSALPRPRVLPELECDLPGRQPTLLDRHRRLMDESLRWPVGGPEQAVIRLIGQ